MRLTILLLPFLAACASAPPPAANNSPVVEATNRGRTEVVAFGEGESVIVGVPAGLPSDYVPSLRAALAKEPAVRSARLFQAYSASDKVINVVLAVEFDGSDTEVRALVNRIGPIAAPPVERMGRSFSLVRSEQAASIIPDNAIEVYVRG